MDDVRFDHLVRMLVGSATRRGVVGVLAGVMGLGLDRAVAKGNKGRGKKRGQAKSRPASPPGKKAGKSKVTICHYDRESDTYKRITVAQPAVAAHIRHGDFRHRDCCMDADCRGDQVCQKGTCSCRPGWLDCDGDKTCESCGSCGVTSCPEDPSPDGGPGFCCDNGTCSCGGDCCEKDQCYWTGPRDAPTDEFCCIEPDFVICGEGDATTCCPKVPEGDSCVPCEANPSGIAGSYRRPR